MRYVLTVLLLFCVTPVFASEMIVTQRPYYNNFHSPYYNNYYAQENRFRNHYYPERNYYNQQYKDFSRLENYVFDRNFSRDNSIARLERLERQVFGAVQQGDFNTRYENAKMAILSRPKVGTYKKQSLIKSIGDYFSGQLTGYTPEIEENIFAPQTYTPDFEKRKYTTYSSPWGNGYKYDDYDTHSTTGIKILD